MRLLLFILILCAPGVAFGNARLPVGCSASLFKMEGMTLDQKALILTAGHCANLGSFSEPRMVGLVFPGPRQVLLDQPDSGQVYIRGIGGKFRRHHYSRVILATMTGVDVAILELDETYGTILARQKDAEIYELSPVAPSPGAPMLVESARWNVDFNCEVEKVVPTVREAPWTWTNVIRFRFSPACIFYGGVSGSPVLDRDHRIVAVANTGSDPGTPCDFAAPCEVDAGGEVTVAPPGQSYATPTRSLYDCFSATRRTFDFVLPSCRLVPSDPGHVDALAPRGIAIFGSKRGCARPAARCRRGESRRAEPHRDLRAGPNIRPALRGFYAAGAAPRFETIPAI